MYRFDSILLRRFQQAFFMFIVQFLTNVCCAGLLVGSLLQSLPTLGSSIPNHSSLFVLFVCLCRGACGEVKLAFKKGSACERFAVKVISKKKFTVGVSLFGTAMELIYQVSSLILKMQC